LSVPTGELRVVEDVPGAFAELVAEQIRTETGPVAPGGGRFRLVLSGGSTARACYERLGATGGIEWERVECLVGDERCVPADDPDSNQHMIREALLEKLDEAPGFVPMNCDDPPEAYEAVIAASAQLDLVHLGLGPDGHTASLFPNSAGLDAPAGRLVVNNVDPSGRNPHLRLTLTYSGLARARLVVFSVAGAEKHEALTRLLRHEDLPASRVRAASVLWLVDREAIGSGAAGLG
jgi:6-phosphogluconolactonase